MSEITQNQLWEMIATFNQDKTRILDWICETLGGVKKNRFVTLRTSNELASFKRIKDMQRKLTSTKRSSVQPPDNSIIFEPNCSELEKVDAEEQPPMEVDINNNDTPSSTPQKKKVKPFSKLSAGG